MKTAEALYMYWIMDYRDCTVFSHFLATIALPYVLFQVLDHAAMHPSHWLDLGSPLFLPPRLQRFTLSLQHHQH